VVGKQVTTDKTSGTQTAKKRHQQKQMVIKDQEHHVGEDNIEIATLVASLGDHWSPNSKDPPTENI
jgi:hypothetical protein